MSLVFHYAPNSTATVTTLVLAELGIPCERVRQPFGASGTKSPEFLALNPNGRVPVIVHDGVPIWESGAITMYLGEVFGVERGLYPAAGPRRGQAMTWIVWANVRLAEAAGRLAEALPPGNEGGVEVASADWVVPEARDATAAGKARGDTLAALAILDGALAGRDYLLGDYTLADTHLAAFVGWVAMLGVDLTPFARLGAWMGRCAGRPAFAVLAEG
ncbi:glutathione S-transferase family protein [Roseomonas sp. CCTCC AB2023176]|uniref:glutathione S-transferase family protein n=1 Tax=Roseomonas sp. CCTCC AB2023176 TaxID=3342640 RepID=UPI0035D60D1E